MNEYLEIIILTLQKDIIELSLRHKLLSDEDFKKEVYKLSELFDKLLEVLYLPENNDFLQNNAVDIADAFYCFDKLKEFCQL